MKLNYILFLSVGLAAMAASAQDKKPAAPFIPSVPVAPATLDKEKFSYAIGMNFGNWMKQNQMDVNIETITAAMKDIMNGSSPRISESEMSQVMNTWKSVSRAKREQELKDKGKAGDEFREKFAKEAGVKQLPDGLEYKMLVEGNGELAKATDTVKVKYQGTFIDGSEFDHNDSFTTQVSGGVIRGWTEMLQLMKPGSKVHVVIPPDLAYGPMGRQPKIPPMSTLAFDMELISILPPAPAPAPRRVTNSGTANSGQPQNQVVSGEIIKVPSKAELDKGAKIEVIKAEDIKDGKVVPPK